jgi:hypothetical protein
MILTFSLFTATGQEDKTIFKSRTAAYVIRLIQEKAYPSLIEMPRPIMVTKKSLRNIFRGRANR